ncbi:MAG: tRNA-dihydrouridine synthase, partial [Bifidobacteriaceae bacterium]|nr:tRNA-dihydrouridine synthase [Bifidobacteriaceae bacterium]
MADRATPLRLGPLTAPSRVVLAPMAGVTNAPFRTLCAGYGPGLYVSEMVSARALAQRQPAALHAAAHAPAEPRPWSVQLYATDPAAA